MTRKIMMEVKQSIPRGAQHESDVGAGQRKKTSLRGKDNCPSFDIRLFDILRFSGLSGGLVQLKEF